MSVVSHGWTSPLTRLSTCVLPKGPHPDKQPSCDIRCTVHARLLSPPRHEQQPTPPKEARQHTVEAIILRSCRGRDVVAKLFLSTNCTNLLDQLDCDWLGSALARCFCAVKVEDTVSAHAEATPDGTHLRPLSQQKLSQPKVVAHRPQRPGPHLCANVENHMQCVVVCATKKPGERIVLTANISDMLIASCDRRCSLIKMHSQMNALYQKIAP